MSACVGSMGRTNCPAPGQSGGRHGWRRLRLVSWNVNGLRAVCERHKGVIGLLRHLGADIVCFQETKFSTEVLDEAILLAAGYRAFVSFCRRRGGYSGVATYVREDCLPVAAEEGVTGRLRGNPAVEWAGEETGTAVGPCPSAEELRRWLPRTALPQGDAEQAPLPGVDELDGEGRCIITDHGSFVLFNVYFPNMGDATIRHVYKTAYNRLLEARVRSLRAQGRAVVVVGDLNARASRADAWWADDPTQVPEHVARRMGIHPRRAGGGGSEEGAPVWPADAPWSLEAQRRRRRGAEALCRDAQYDTAFREAAWTGPARRWADSGGNSCGGDAGKEEEAPPSTCLARCLAAGGTLPPEAEPAVDGQWDTVWHLSRLWLRRMELPARCARGAALTLTRTLRPSAHPPLSHLSPLCPSFGGCGLLDTFRVCHPSEQRAFSCWDTKTGARANNCGSRIDAVLMDERLVAAGVLLDASVERATEGSDHCPVAALLRVPTAPPAATATAAALPAPVACAVAPPWIWVGNAAAFKTGRQAAITSFFATGAAAPPQPAPSPPPPSLPRAATVPGPSSADPRAGAGKARGEAGRRSAPPRQQAQGRPSAPLGKRVRLQTPPSRQRSLAAMLGRSDPDAPSSHGDDAPAAAESAPKRQRSVAGPGPALGAGEQADRGAAACQWRSLLVGAKPPPRCKGHDLPCARRVVKKDGPTQGRVFWVCKLPVGRKGDKVARCDHFEWADAPKRPGVAAS